MEFDQTGKVVASNNIVVQLPWSVLKSKKYEGIFREQKNQEQKKIKELV